MESFHNQFSASNTNPSITAASFSSQNMSHPQNVNLAGNIGQLAYPAPHHAPYDQNQRFQYLQPLAQENQRPLCPSQILGKSDVGITIPNSKPSQLQEVKRAKSRLAREKRKQVRQRIKIATPVAPAEGTREKPRTTRRRSNVSRDRNGKIFVTPDGKTLNEILTKVLRATDVSTLNRIVLPKGAAEMYLPALREKEAIHVMLKDVNAELRWAMKFKKQYVSVTKERNQEAPQHPTNMQRLLALSADNHNRIQASQIHHARVEPNASLTELSDTNEAEGSSDILHPSNGHIVQPQLPAFADDNIMQFEINGNDNIVQHDMIINDNLVQGELLNNAAKEAPVQPMEVAAAPVYVQINNDQEANMDDVFANLDNILEIEGIFHGLMTGIDMKDLNVQCILSDKVRAARATSLLRSQSLPSSILPTP
ncbi:hypothetical protein Fmac_005350 [Flemingia macrophylla]|uniref:Uncharacterized protein n=1 Tax=Flemingia macrophylla TaxID=520843 RepID=A0ABD1N7L7_9FABA